MNRLAITQSIRNVVAQLRNRCDVGGQFIRFLQLDSKSAYGNQPGKHWHLMPMHVPAGEMRPRYLQPAYASCGIPTATSSRMSSRVS